jgi:hypothetical protein
MRQVALASCLHRCPRPQFLDARPYDFGSNICDGRRTVDRKTPVTLDELRASIKDRDATDYNEWVVADFKVIGLFAAQPFRIWAKIKLAPKCAEFLGTTHHEDFTYTDAAQVEEMFAGFPVYGFESGRLAMRASGSWVETSHVSLYPHNDEL